jgi:hypothetical protein
MKYLTLDASERQAIDWIGDRYSHGDDLFRALCQTTMNDEWDGNCDVTFECDDVTFLPIKVAILGDHLECFSPKFHNKLWDFANQE